MEESAPLRSLKGVGDKTEKLFQKLGIYTVGDLLHYYPREYDRYTEPVTVKEAVEKGAGKAAVAARITGNVDVKIAGKSTIVSTVLTDRGEALQLIWFHMPFLRNVLKRGGAYIFRGKVAEKRHRMVMEHPQIFTREEYEKLQNGLQPVYSLTAGITNKLLVKMIRQVLEQKELAAEYLPEEVRNAYRLSEYNFAVSQIHFPENQESMVLGRRRLAFDEFLFFILGIQLLKEKKTEEKNLFDMKPVWETEKVIEQLPYRLTNAQTQVWHEIERDMTGHTLMNRLVQGDVGSGKTILAFLAMILAGTNGYQSALMVPTEVLARQHWEGLRRLIKDSKLTGLEPILLTGSSTAKEKREAYAMIAEGKAKMIVGTHALIQEKVVYQNIALVITDEQHRFGVQQREILSKKGGSPHVLVMSATPIPRTLAIILYGDLDISVIDELPAKRLPIKNCVVDTSYRPKAYAFMQRQIEAGHQVYIICPMVEESEGMEAENVLDYTNRLKTVFPSQIVVESLHGRMKPAKKNQIMEAFAENKIQVLVSTTVIEVGVNVPNAVVMMVENAERFGLAQLHQLRGRVGRGDVQSYCIFMHNDAGEEIQKRLEILEKSNDGFFIAGEDLRLRGPGDLFGVRQSGSMEFKIADVYQDANILKEASEAAGGILALDPELALEQHRPLREELEKYMKSQAETLGL
ncbi:ATP-dependent DNA helicase RecG [Lactonifactor longoviformis]|uniref:ATP-dependent DNA helicase RecG n=1 Tax=Lactonifactor longoviformis DSM 17459 TaxID=1122155 RepID=A0A1M4WU78_9CLOT|nr:ATP-dependent DNA helicase RecG [Lactonifactor longoviformis]POP31497.1 ATP-dependent DNA helicase RecG [Lactonifactor longoviformis]SHE84809.1 ATP-dependent DNA helicase RecG [Lactonifactor longoviformis DSM 17459]